MRLGRSDRADVEAAIRARHSGTTLEGGVGRRRCRSEPLHGYAGRLSSARDLLAILWRWASPIGFISAGRQHSAAARP
jgi:hypothetical protein